VAGSALESITNVSNLAIGQMRAKACLPDFVAVRDTKNRDGGTLIVARDAWTAFVDGVKDCEFDI
jgi:hypothetical protein